MQEICQVDKNFGFVYKALDTPRKLEVLDERLMENTGGRTAPRWVLRSPSTLTEKEDPAR